MKPLHVNLRHLDTKDVDLEGVLSPEDLEIEGVDELIRFPEGVKYDLEAQRLEQNLLVTGNLQTTLQCECVRCLKRFNQPLELTDWICHLPLEGDDKVDVNGDLVDLTPYIREDILLAFPQHPLCDAECKGLPVGSAAKVKKASGEGKKIEEKSSPWAELNKLKL
jgi:uncharacterized metal-binding protein YceD (DUF177 family)